ncbi:NlpC/P60 family protein [Mesorhizobium sp. RP14(2022)]|uniref:NlpC/P60 family protein n=1 Tax=Mesorhizobium liriopis TaxID=2953882 RepID=A0ABT1CB86_9HYPH|nr:NlpC/P60 family protein [Mesorhizobium liriopis]MCO6051451.1 NlpC/P60 family protein [Mesorhizobium liriopis]
MAALDKRLNAFRPDLADARLKGHVEAKRFVEGRAARVIVPVADLKHEPRHDAGLDTQLIFGTIVQVFDSHEDWAWVQAERDGYVGYLSSEALGAPADRPTHIVSAARTFLYPGPDMKLPRTGTLSLGSELVVTDWTETRGSRYGRLDTGEWAMAVHLREIDATEQDFVAIAERLLGTPYLWGGASGFGIDCSGLVQLSLRMAGRTVLRDTDMQAGSVGETVDGADLRRGDLVFWRSHVGIMRDAETLIHANGHTMDVALEPLRDAVERIGYLYGQPTVYRRP